MFLMRFDEECSSVTTSGDFGIASVVYRPLGWVDFGGVPWADDGPDGMNARGINSFFREVWEHAPPVNLWE